MHLPDAIVMFVVIPFFHLMNDEDTKTIILNEGWYQAIRHMFGIYIEPPKNLKESSKFYNQRTRQILAPTGQNDEQNVQALSHPITESMTHQNSSSKDNRVLYSEPVKYIAKLRDVKNDKEFVTKREEILSMIWDMEEEIMGKEI